MGSSPYTLRAADIKTAGNGELTITVHAYDNDDNKLLPLNKQEFVTRQKYGFSHRDCDYDLEAIRTSETEVQIIIDAN